ncbi:hypothetical protein IE53DRAFT_383804 [Violaceomyces palustris]|uniref:Uncharacterized protein n=1 Tax=Violaceomyces palustris TaxID=1673888 RepID=A0ACD0P6D2_9BASI|nr:hypothetical protein IE53DRAFT_383804 [Violaceomyces palustris]
MRSPFFCFVSLSLSLLSLTSATTIYLQPAASPHPTSAPAFITAPEANVILSHHFDIQQESSIQELSDTVKSIWNHIPNTWDENRRKVERLFKGERDDAKNRMMVMIHGLSGPEEEVDLIPSQLVSPATHKLQVSQDLSSIHFDALLRSYTNKMRDSFDIADSSFSHFGSAFLDGFEKVALGIEGWFMGSVSEKKKEDGSHAHPWSQGLDQSLDGPISMVKSELDSLYSFLESISASTDNKSGVEKDLTFQPLRFQGLGKVKSTYGASSLEFKRASEATREALEKLVERFNQVSKSSEKVPSIAFVFTEEGEEAIRKRSLSIPSESDLLSAFSTRSPRSSRQTLKASASRKVDLHKSCFTSEKDLLDATSGCSGHGKGIQTSKGGRKCWKCSCTKTYLDQTKKGGKRVQNWAGLACEKKDVSSPFVLFATTVLVLVSVAVGSVLYLFYEGTNELPGTLAGVTINLK